jgi:excisionase family DNA binding protein
VTDAAGPPSSYSTAYVARRLGVSVPTVQRWVDAGHLRAWKTVGGHRRIEAESAERLFRSQAGQAAAGVAAPPCAPVSVVIVDDNPDDRELLVVLVENALPGAGITVAENGFQGLVAIGRHAPRLVVTDIAMPHMDGLRMLRELAGHAEVRPGAMIAVSSRTPAQLAAQGGLPPGVRFVAKPIDPAVFAAAVEAALPDGAD